MAKLINKTQGFTVVNNEILRNKELGIKERGLLITLLSLPDSWEFSVLGLTKILPDGKDAINAGIRKLEKMGYVRRIQTKNEAGQFNGYDWEVSDTPFAENPSTEKPFTENPLTENPSQSNTNQSNTNLVNTNYINPSFIHSERGKEKKEKVMLVREELKMLMGYEQLEGDDIAVDLFELCVEICSNENNIRINGREVPASIFQSKIRKLYYEDLMRIADQIRSQKHKIKNIKNYMMTALYNETVISNVYYTNRVKVDMG